MRTNFGLVAVWIVLSSLGVASADEPGRIDSAKLAIRAYVASAAPEATAAQARHFGLLLPVKLDTTKPLVVLVPGLDMACSSWNPMFDRLSRAGYQVAWFCYPEDQPIADDVSLLRDRMITLRKTYPGLMVDVVAYSMGSLVARGYVEGPDYVGSVDRLIMLAPPNHGSSWAHLAWVAKVHEQACLCLNDPEWHASWFVTSGLCEAGDDLLPGSKFLLALNAFQRRDGVRYTIVEGDASPIKRIAANVVSTTAHWIPVRTIRLQFLENLQNDLCSKAAKLRGERTSSDGPVTIGSAQLDGVTDVVRIHADHDTMIDADGNTPPAAWDTIRDRLAH